MTPETISILKGYGIEPPNRGKSTTCPWCSDERMKRNERCLKIYENPSLRWICFHCHWEGPR